MNETDLARLIATLEHLKHPFDRKQIGTLPATANRPALDYVNHAHVTNRLNQYAPDWNYTIDEKFTQDGKCWVRGTMTIFGASRVEFGNGKDPLEAVSHFIRRAAMRFGVATDLWAKEDFEEDSARAQSSTLPAQRTGPRAEVPTPSTSPGATNVSSEPETFGEGVNGSGPRYLSKEDQGLLRVEYGSPTAALKAYRARFGERITRLGDITYEMRDEMSEAMA